MSRARVAGHRLVLVLLLVWFVVPLVPLVLWASAEQWTPATVLPQRWGPGGFAAALDGDGAAALLRSLALGCTVALLATPAGAMAARALTLDRVRAPRLVSALLIAPVALPVFAVVMGLDTVLLRLRVPGAVGIVLVLTVAALPYTTYLMRVTYGSYSFAFEDEAKTLGASRRSLLWRVRLPLVAPGLAAATFLAFLVGWSDYIVTLLIGGGQLVTLPILVASAASGTGGEPTVAALSVIALAPPAAALVSVGLLRRLLGPRRTGRDPGPPGGPDRPVPSHPSALRGAA